MAACMAVPGSPRYLARRQGGTPLTGCSAACCSARRSVCAAGRTCAGRHHCHCAHTPACRLLGGRRSSGAGGVCPRLLLHLHCIVVQQRLVQLAIIAIVPAQSFPTAQLALTYCNAKLLVQTCDQYNCECAVLGRTSLVGTVRRDAGGCEGIGRDWGRGVVGFLCGIGLFDHGCSAVPRPSWRSLGCKQPSWRRRPEKFS